MTNDKSAIATPAQALAVLDIMTDPRNAAKLIRADYANAEVALTILAEFVRKNTPTDDGKEVTV